MTFKTTIGDEVTVYTTRADTLFGATYMVISPGAPAARSSGSRISPTWSDVEAYQAEAARKSDFERSELNKDKTGVRLDGIEAINPVNGTRICRSSSPTTSSWATAPASSWACPAHDQRDWEFANKFGLPIIEVVSGGDVTKEAFIAKDDTGIMVNSGFLNGMTVKEAIPAMKKCAGGAGLRPREGQL